MSGTKDTMYNYLLKRIYYWSPKKCKIILGAQFIKMVAILNFVSIVPCKVIALYLI